MTGPRPRFVKGRPTGRELTRYLVVVHRNHSDLILGCVVSIPWGQASAFWLAYPDGDPDKVLRQPSPSADPWVFVSRRDAGNALLLNWQKEHTDG